MTNNKNTTNGSLWTKTVSLLAVFVLGVVSAFALPGTTATNLQTTAGVNVTTLGSTLNVTALDKSVLTWQNFGSGADSIAVGDVLNFTLPNKNSAVLNIVAGGLSTTIDGTILSNGNVFVLNPNGVLVGNGARIDVNKMYIGTSDNADFASFYFQQNGKLPSQDGLVPLAGGTIIAPGAIIRVNENITIASKNITVGGAFIQGNAFLTADGSVSVGSSGLTYIDGNLDIKNANGTTTVGSAGNSFIVTGNAVVTGGANSTFSTNGAATVLQTKSLTVSGGNINADRVNTNNVSINGNNVTVAIGSATGNPVVNVTGNGTVVISAPSSLSANVTNTAAVGSTSVSSGGTLTIGKVDIGGTGTSTFTGTNVVDSSDRIFVYGSVAFNATTGNITLNKGKHGFGPLSVSAPLGEAFIVEDAATNLNVVNTPKFTLRSAGYVFQTPVTGVINSLKSNITANGDITLNAANNSGGSYTLVGDNITLKTNSATTLTSKGNNIFIESTGPVTLNDVDAAGTLTVISTGIITQDDGTKVNSNGETGFNGNGLKLTNPGNRFGALKIDVGLAGAAEVSENSTVNLLALRADYANIRSDENVISSGTLPVTANSLNVFAAKDFVPNENVQSKNPIAVLAGNNVDLSLLSISNNLNGKAPTVVGNNVKPPKS